MSDNSSGPVELYRARNLAEAHTLRLLLEAEGIVSMLENEALQGALGEVPLGWTTAPKLVVRHHDEAAAREILEEFLQRQQERNHGDVTTELSCLACGEPMATDVVCPKCGWSYRETGDSPTGVKT